MFWQAVCWLHRVLFCGIRVLSLEAFDFVVSEDVLYIAINIILDGTDVQFIIRFNQLQVFQAKFYRIISFGTLLTARCTGCTVNTDGFLSAIFGYWQSHTSHNKHFVRICHSRHELNIGHRSDIISFKREDGS